MSELLRIALRNVRRHPRRTLITAGAVSFGVAVLVVSSGFVAFTSSGLRESMVYGGTGHLQILVPGADWRERIGAQSAREIRGMLTARADVEEYGARVEFQALLSSAAATVAVAGLGVEPSAESKIRMLTTMRAGRWFTGQERMPKALLGSGLADQLGVAPRDLLAVIAYSDRGRMTAAEVQVAGIFESGVVEYDARTVLVPLETAQALMEDDGINSFAVTLGAVYDSDRSARALSAVLAGHGAAARTWRELSPVYDRVMALYRWILNAFMVVIAVVVTMGIANTMSMAVLERVSEVAVMRALGLGRPRIVTMFLMEAGTIALLGLASGIAIGCGACEILTRVGIEMPPPPGYSQGYVMEVPVVPYAVVGAAALALLSTVVAAIGPSLRAVRGEVSEAMRAV